MFTELRKIASLEKLTNRKTEKRLLAECTTQWIILPVISAAGASKAVLTKQLRAKPRANHKCWMVVGEQRRELTHIPQVCNASCCWEDWCSYTELCFDENTPTACRGRQHSWNGWSVLGRVRHHNHHSKEVEGSLRVWTSCYPVCQALTSSTVFGKK